MSQTPKDPTVPTETSAAEQEPRVFSAQTAMFSVPQQPMAQTTPEPAFAAEPPAVLPEGLVWHVVIGAAQEGPMTMQDLGIRLAAGSITPQTLVWRGGMANWSALQEVPELKDLLTAGAVPPAPPGPPVATLSPGAGAALDALMRADLDHGLGGASAPAAAAVAPQQPAISPEPRSLAGQDLFGNSETQFLQVPGAVASAAPSGPAAAAAAPAATPAAAAAPKAAGPARKTRAVYIAAVAVVSALGAACGYIFWARSAPAPIEAPAPEAAAAAPAPVAPLPTSEAAPAPAEPLPAAPVEAAPATPAEAAEAPSPEATEAPAPASRAKRSSKHRRGHSHRRGQHPEP